MDKQCYPFGMVRRWLALACVAVLCASACGNDFDALFSASTGAIDSGTKGDASKPTTCSPPASSCAPITGCKDQGCSYACNGCDCSCPAYDCPRGNNTDACVAECGAGTTCDVDCDVGDCQLAAHGAVAKFRCQADDCAVTCDDAASCDVRCENDRACEVKCTGKGTTCQLFCSAAPDTCNLTCTDGQLRQCPGNIQTCNRECPN